MKLLTTRASLKPLYAILGLPEEATPEEIHSAFLNLSMAHHPDKQAGLESDFYRAAKAAYDVLSDPEKRRLYDETGIDPQSADQKYLAAIVMIREILTSLVGDLLDDHKMPTIDVSLKVAEQLRKAKQELVKQKTESDKLAKRAEKLSGDIETRWQGGVELKQSMIGAVDEETARAIQESITIQQQIEETELALEIVKSFRLTLEFESESPMSIFERMAAAERDGTGIRPKGRTRW
jgi:hypothetical protein